MNRKELKAELDRLKIKPHIYSINGSLKPNTYVLLHSRPKWHTFFYDERGNVEERKEFLDENSACDHLLERLIYTIEWQKKYNLE